MNITVRYFARVRELLGPQEAFDLSSLGASMPATVGELRAWLAGQSAQHAQALAPHQGLRCAMNQTMCSPDERLTAGAEVAFFPPVTGG